MSQELDDRAGAVVLAALSDRQRFGLESQIDVQVPDEPVVEAIREFQGVAANEREKTGEANFVLRGVHAVTRSRLGVAVGSVVVVLSDAAASGPSRG